MRSLIILCLGLLVVQVAASVSEADENDDAPNKRVFHGLRVFVRCEHQSGTMKCPGRKRLKIVYANYGRRHRYVCPHKSIKSTYCISSFSSRLIRCACNGRNSCPLFAKNEVFGDPCVGTFKYIKVYYRCV